MQLPSKFPRIKNDWTPIIGQGLIDRNGASVRKPFPQNITSKISKREKYYSLQARNLDWIFPQPAHCFRKVSNEISDSIRATQRFTRPRRLRCHPLQQVWMNALRHRTTLMKLLHGEITDALHEPCRDMARIAAHHSEGVSFDSSLPNQLRR